MIWVGVWVMDLIIVGVDFFVWKVGDVLRNDVIGLINGVVEEVAFDKDEWDVEWEEIVREVD